MQSTLERFRDAILVLVGCGPVKQRLALAYHAYLSSLALDDLPREMRNEYSSLAAAFHSARRTGSLDAVSASVLKMSEAEACQHAQAIVQMFGCLQEAPSVSRPATLLRAVPDEQDLPAFLNRA